MATFHIPENEFLDILRSCAGIYSNTAKAIEEKYKIKYTRQAARDRALNHPLVLQEIRETVKDIAEATLISLMQSGSETMKYRIATDYLERFAKERGYMHKADIEIRNQFANLPSKPMTEIEMAAYMRSLRDEFNDKD